MDAFSTEAINSLKAAVESFLPDISEPAVQIILTFYSLNLTPTGLGGFVGINENPHGGILGKRLEATVAITLRADSAEALDTAANAVTVSLVGADRVALMKEGILRLNLDEVAPQINGMGGGANSFIEQALKFKVLYEFLQLPQEAGDIIQQIPITVDVS